MRRACTLALALTVMMLISTSVAAQAVRLRKGDFDETHIELIRRQMSFSAVEGQVAGGGVGPLCADCTVGAVDCNGSVTGSLAEGDCQINLGGGPVYVDSWELTIPEEFGAVRIDLGSEDFDTILILIIDTAACNGGPGNDDCDPAIIGDSCLQGLIDPGTYYVFATSFDSLATGNYEITVQCVEAPKLAATTPWGAMVLSIMLLATACYVFRRQRGLALES